MGDFMVEDININEIRKLLDGRDKINSKEIKNYNISTYVVNKLISYNILQRVNNNYVVIGRIELLNEKDAEKELDALNRTYTNYLQKEDYQNAYKYLKEYIDICKINGIDGHYYYKLQTLDEEIKLSELPENDRKKAKLLHNKFDLLINENKGSEALEVALEYNRCTRENNIFSYLLPAIAYNKLKDNQNAKEYLLKASNIFDKSPTIYLELAKLYIRTNKLDSAQAALDKLFELDGKNLNGYILEYKTKFLSGNYDDTINIFEKAKEKLNKKKYKYFTLEALSFNIYQYHLNKTIIDKIKEISYSDITLSEKIYAINEYVMGLETTDATRTVALVSSLDVIESEVREIYRQSITESDRDFAKPYIKKYEGINEVRKYDKDI